MRVQITVAGACKHFDARNSIASGTTSPLVVLEDLRAVCCGGEFGEVRNTRLLIVCNGSGCLIVDDQTICVVLRYRIRVGLVRELLTERNTGVAGVAAGVQGAGMWHTIIDGFGAGKSRPVRQEESQEEAAEKSESRRHENRLGGSAAATAARAGARTGAGAAVAPSTDRALLSDLYGEHGNATIN